MREKISFSVVVDETVHQVVTHEGEYRNLMVLIRDKVYVEDFGDCGGMGRCGTCLVSSDHLYRLTPFDRNQSATLGKLDQVNENSRLSCQYPINKSFQGITVKIVSSTDSTI